MTEMIVANSNGAEIRAMEYSEYDFEVGDKENSFLVTCLRSEWKNIPANARIFIPGSEFGGIYKKTEANTKNGTIAAGGYTWRGMLQKKVICPESGEDYATDSGELNSIINSRVSAAYPNLFVGSSESTGITVSNYQYGRYVTVYDGLKDLLESVGYKMALSYNQELFKVVVSAVPIDDFSSEIEFSSDMNADYNMQLDSMGVNHLICLGQGELRDRTVIDLYVDENGVISQSQTFFDEEEIAAVYNYPGASDSDLMQSGVEHLKQEINRNKFSIDLESLKDVYVGDIVGARDYVTGLTMKAPITGKVVKWRNGYEKTEYKLSENITVEQASAVTLTAVTLAAAPPSLSVSESNAETTAEAREDETA